MLIPGLCSVTLRDQSIEGVVQAAQAAGLAGIEWGTDVHVPDEAAAARAAVRCADAGLRVLSLGSYYRLGDHAPFEPTVAAAVAAGSPRIRVWAGRSGSTETAEGERAGVVRDAQRIGELAAEAGLQIALEYHPNTLTDTSESTLGLLAGIGHPAVRTYWQPPVGADDDAALASLAALGPAVAGLHVFSWWPDAERLPLEGRAALWAGVIGHLRANGRGEDGGDLDLMLEFTLGDSAEQLRQDAATLRRLLAP